MSPDCIRYPLTIYIYIYIYKCLNKNVARKCIITISKNNFNVGLISENIVNTKYYVNHFKFLKLLVYIYIYIYIYICGAIDTQST